MKYMGISSLGAAYWYAVKIERKLKQKMRQFGSGNPTHRNLILCHVPLALCDLLFSIFVTPRGCVNEVVQPLRCTHVFEGRWVHSLGMFPSFLTLSQMQPKSPSIILRQVRCVPPWCCASPSCTQGAPSHTPNVFVFPTNRSLPFSLHPSFVESSKGVCTLGGCRGRPLHFLYLEENDLLKSEWLTFQNWLYSWLLVGELSSIHP